jgi:inhibitor of KinA
MEWQFYGRDAVLIRFAERIGDEAFGRSRALIQELESRPPPGMVEFAPAFTTLLLEFDPEAELEIADMMPDLLSRLQKAATKELPSAKLHEIPVVYDGPDLQRVAESNQLSVESVCRLHSEPEYKVYFLGFAPGFPYLGDLDPRLRTPRLASPRLRVPAGSVAIGGEHTGIYPLETPGGWNIIGHTATALFDPSRKEEHQSEADLFLLRPGDRVKFIPAAIENS